MANNLSLYNTIDQNNPKMKQLSKHRLLFDYFLSTLLHPPAPVWSSTRLAKIQERRPIKDPIFIYLNPMNTVQYTSNDN
ncbi:unnamed protein product, partial [Rotaria sordida]